MKFNHIYKIICLSLLMSGEYLFPPLAYADMSPGPKDYIMPSLVVSVIFLIPVIVLWAISFAIIKHIRKVKQQQNNPAKETENSTFQRMYRFYNESDNKK